MANFKRKGCGPRGLGASPLKMNGRNYVFSNDDTSSMYDAPRSSNPNDYARIWSYDKVDITTPGNKGKKTMQEMNVTQKGGTFNVPTASDKSFADDINKEVSNSTMIPYERGVYNTPKSTRNKITPQSKASSTSTKTNNSKPSGKVAYGGTKTWAEGSKSAKSSTGKSLNQLVAARKGLKKGSAEYNTIQNQINAALGSKVRHSTPAKKKGYGKKRR
jgi:hypothetical protein